MKIFIFGLIFICSVQAFEQISSFEEKTVLEGASEENGDPTQTKSSFESDWEEFKTTSKPPTPPKNMTVKLYKALQFYFYAEVMVGSPGQRFKMLPDLSVVNSWMPSILCSPFANPACALRNRYQSSKSTTFRSLKANKTICSDKGNFFGFLGKEKFIVGELSVFNHTFVEIETMPLSQTFYAQYDGILGLGMDGKTDQESNSFTQRLFQQYPSLNKVFSFYFLWDETTHKGGTLFLGGSEKKHYNGSFTYLSVKDPYYWSFKMDKVTIDYILPYRNTTAEVCSSGCEAFPSTGDVLIQGPVEDIKTINRLLSANYVPFLNRYEVNCNTISLLPKIIFHFGGRPFPLKPRHYIQKLTYGPVRLCLSSFVEFSSNLGNQFWGLGVSFLSQYYTEYDLKKKRVGIARAVGN